MNPFPPPRESPSKSWRLAIGVLALLAPVTARAQPPAAPTEVKIHYTLAGLAANGSPTSDGSVHSCMVQWTDRARDEEGYTIKILAGSPLALVAQENFGPDTTEVTLPSIKAITPPASLQAIVQCWKTNGNKIEFSAAATANYTLPDPLPIPGDLSRPNLATPVIIGDNLLQISWTESSNSELYHEVLIAEDPNPLVVGDATNFQTIEFAPFADLIKRDSRGFPIANSVTRSYNLRLIPQTAYVAKVRALRQASKTAVGADSMEVTWTTPPLIAPSFLRSEALSETLINLSWQDNSSNETGYEIFRSPTGQNEFVSLGTTASGATAQRIAVKSNEPLDWKIRAVYSYTDRNNQSQLRWSAFSNTVSTGEGFAAPTNLVANGSSGLNRTAVLTWSHNSSSEYGYEVETRPVGTETWCFARAVPANVSRVEVNSRSTSAQPGAATTSVALESGVSHEFRVFALASDATRSSTPSNIASCEVHEGFTSKMYGGGRVGTAMNLTVEAAGDPAPLLSATSLPLGLSFDDSVTPNRIVGIPMQSGIFIVNLRAAYPVLNRVSNASMTLRILPQAATPGVSRRLGISGTMTLGLNRPQIIQLNDHFTDPDASRVVLVDTNLPRGAGTDLLSFKLRLYPEVAPAAVANFMAYVNAGDYDRLVFHRLVDGFVLQGGSLRAAGPGNSFKWTDSRPPPLNEPGISNTRFTLSAAKLGAQTPPPGSVGEGESIGFLGNPDSATTDFFINLNDNSENLDNQNGGFTVFGHVANADQTVLSAAIDSLNVANFVDANSGEDRDETLDRRLQVDGSAVPYLNFPVYGAQPSEKPDTSKTFQITRVREVASLTYQISIDQPSVALIEQKTPGQLSITGLKPGLANITVHAFDADQNRLTQQLSLNVIAGHIPASITKQPQSTLAMPGGTASLGVTATGTGLTYQWQRLVGSQWQSLADQHSPTLRISPVTEADFASYRVEVTNATQIVTSQTVAIGRQVPVITRQPASLKALPAGSANFSVTAIGTALTYQWQRQVAGLWQPIPGQITNTLRLVAITEADYSNYRVVVSNAAGVINSQAATLERMLPVISRQPVSLSVATGAAASFNVAASGTALTYQWQRLTADQWQPIAGQTSNTLRLTAVSEADFTRYRVNVSNAAGSLLSQEATLSRDLAVSGGALLARLGTPPSPHGNALSTLVVTQGQPFFVEYTQLTGSPAPTVAWTRTGVAIAGKNQSPLSIAAASFTDAGIYQARASNRINAITSPQAARIIVMAAAPQIIEFKTGDTLSLKAPVSGPELTYEWLWSGGSLAGNLTVNQPTLTIVKAAGTARGRYTCRISHSALATSVDCPAIEARLRGLPQMAKLSHENAPPRAFIGTPFRWQLPLIAHSDPLVVNLPYSIKISGLPAGLSCNASGLITGRPSASGSFNLSISISNAAGSAIVPESSPPSTTYTCVLQVAPMPAANAGSFVATLAPSAINGGLGGLLQLTAMDSGAYSISLQLGAEVLRGSGTLELNQGSFTANGGISYQSQLTLTRKNGSQVTTIMALDPAYGYLQGRVTDGFHFSVMQGFRKYWDATLRPCEDYGLQPSIPGATKATYNLVWRPSSTIIEGAWKSTQPQGSGFSVLTTNPSGGASLTGRLPDGTSITYSSFLGPAGEVALFIPLYANTGSAIAQINIADQLVGPNLARSIRGLEGVATWTKLPGGPATRVYAAGTDATDYTLHGASYTPAIKPNPILHFPPPATGFRENASLSFRGAQFENSASQNINGALEIKLDGSGNSVAQVITPGTQRLAISLNNNLGSFSGSATLLDGIISRVVAFQGILVPALPSAPAQFNGSVQVSNEIEGRGAIAEGFFLLPEISANMATARIHSGRVDLLPTPIQVLSAPASQSVVSGSNLQLNISIGDQRINPSYVSYRWRRNGVTLSGENSSFITINSITEAQTGAYDCEVSNGVISLMVPASPAVISIDDRIVSRAGITRTPVTNPVSAATAVTFTATTNSTAPSYQWFKDSVAIANATSATLQIPSASVEDSGTYTVRITSPATPAGVTSSGNLLTVQPAP